MNDADRVRALEAALLEAEQRLARVGELELELREVTTRNEELKQRLATALHERDEARELLERARRTQEDMKSSVSWRLTRPLRAAKRG